MCSIAKKNNIGCYAGQFSKYEGLTVNAVRGDQHRRRHRSSTRTASPTVNTAEAKTGLADLADGLRRTATSRRRPSPTRRSRAARRSRTASCCSCATGPTSTTWPRPTAPPRSRTSSASRRCPASTGPGASTPRRPQRRRSASTPSTRRTALDFLKFIDSEETAEVLRRRRARWPRSLGRSTTTRPSSPSCPYLPVLKTSIENAVPRPVTPFYPAVTKAIQDNAYAAIKGEKTVDQAHQGHAERHRVRRRRADRPAVPTGGAGVTPPAARSPGSPEPSSAGASDRAQLTQTARRGTCQAQTQGLERRSGPLGAGCWSPRPSSLLGVVIVLPARQAPSSMSFQKDAGLDPATGLFVAGRLAGLPNYTHWLLQQCPARRRTVPCPPGTLGAQFCDAAVRHVLLHGRHGVPSRSSSACGSR